MTQPLRARQRTAAPSRTRARGFTLVEVLVALIVVAIGLSALMVAVSGTARTSGYLRDKTIAQWVAINRLSEVRLNSNNKFAKNTDTGELTVAGRSWHYDTQYFNTSIATMQRIVVRSYSGDAKTKGNPLAGSTGFLGSALSQVGGSNVDWSMGSTAATAAANATSGNPGTGVAQGQTPVNGTAVPTTNTGTSVNTPTPAPTPNTPQ
jgi:general secretion pathway protein I